MCRDGYRAKCEQRHCAETVTCRDWPRMCPEHAAAFDIEYDYDVSWPTTLDDAADAAVFAERSEP